VNQKRGQHDLPLIHRCGLHDGNLVLAQALRTRSKPFASEAWRKMRSPFAAAIVAVKVFSGLLSSAWAFASAVAPMVSLERCIGGLQKFEADRSGFGALAHTRQPLWRPRERASSDRFWQPGVPRKLVASADRQLQIQPSCWMRSYQRRGQPLAAASAVQRQRGEGTHRFERSARISFRRAGSAMNLAIAHISACYPCKVAARGEASNASGRMR
jgi:hypothetical protein